MFGLILGTFTKLKKSTINFFMFAFYLSICPSFHKKHFGYHWTGFHEIWYLSIFKKSVVKVQVSLKSVKNNKYFTWRPIYIFYLSRSVLLRMRKVSDKCCRENQNTFYVQKNFCFWQWCRLWDNVNKHCAADRPHVTIKYDSCAWHARYLRLQTHA